MLTSLNFIETDVAFYICFFMNIHEIKKCTTY